MSKVLPAQLVILLSYIVYSAVFGGKGGGEGGGGLGGGGDGGGQGGGGGGASTACESTQGAAVSACAWGAGVGRVPSADVERTFFVVEEVVDDRLPGDSNPAGSRQCREVGNQSVATFLWAKSAREAVLGSAATRSREARHHIQLDTGHLLDAAHGCERVRRGAQGKYPSCLAPETVRSRAR